MVRSFHIRRRRCPGPGSSGLAYRLHATASCGDPATSTVPLGGSDQRESSRLRRRARTSATSPATRPIKTTSRTSATSIAHRLHQKPTPVKRRSGSSRSPDARRRPARFLRSPKRPHDVRANVASGRLHSTPPPPSSSVARADHRARPFPPKRRRGQRTPRSAWCPDGPLSRVFIHPHLTPVCATAHTRRRSWRSRAGTQ